MLVLVFVGMSVILVLRQPSQAEEAEVAYDGKDPLNGTSEGCSGVARSQPAHPDRPALAGPDGQVVGTLGLLTWPGCDVVWGRVLWHDDPAARYQIPAGWTLHIETYRPATNTRVRFPEPATATPVQWAYGPMLATARGCVYAEAYFINSDQEGPHARTDCVTP